MSDENYKEFKRKIVAPYWCEGSPLRWKTPQGIGIAHFALAGQVGSFNLSWWLLNRREPPSVQAYRNTNIRWVILVAPTVLVSGRSLTDHAAMMVQDEFQQMMRECSRVLRQRVEKQDMQWSTLALLAKQKDFRCSQ